MSESSLQISVQPLKRVDLITLAGRVDSNSAPILDNALKESVNNGRHRLVLELSQVDYMSSAGLRSLISTLRECKKRNGDLRLAAPSERVTEVFSLAGLDSLFQVYDDQTTAVGSF
ncbi:MAG: STAS domain-containing protein [Anaerolineae bacterium]